jgi:diguanylate cyclase (GGDEF)-like protein
MNEKEKNEEIADITVTDSHAITTRSASFVRRALVGLSSADMARVIEAGKALTSSFKDVVGVLKEKVGELFPACSTWSLLLAGEKEPDLYFRIVGGKDTHLEVGRESADALREIRIKLGQGIAGWVAQRCEAVVVPDVRVDSRFLAAVDVCPEMEVRSIVAVPLRFPESPPGLRTLCMGVIELINCVGSGGFSQTDLSVLQTLADFAAIGIKNACIFSEEQEKTRHLTLIRNISSHAISTLYPDELLAGFTEQLENELTYDHIGIAILDYTTRELHIQAEGGKRRGAVGLRLPLDTCLIGQVARTGKTAIFRSLPSSLNGPKPVLADSLTAMALPIYYADFLQGVLYVESIDRIEFSEEESLLLRTIADLIGGALHNALSFQKAMDFAITDGLTGVKTRRFFMEALASESKRSTRANRPFSLVALNIEDFAGLSGSLSWKTFNRLFLEIGHEIETICRRSDVVSHYGDGEFVLIFPETSKEEACRIAQMLHTAIKEKIWLAEDSHHPRLTASVGVAAYPDDGDNAVEVWTRMHDALALLKNSTRGGVAAAKIGVLSPL